MRKWAAAAIVLSALISGAAAVPAGAEQLGGISGKVTDSGGAPLAGVEVSVNPLFGGSTSTATSLPDGTFTVGGLPAGQYYVCFDAQDATGGSSTSGYVKTCWKNAPAWDGISLDA